MLADKINAPADEPATSQPDALMDSLASTLDQIARLKQRRETLKQAQRDAEAQLVHRVGVAHRRGDLSEQDLVDLYYSLREASQREPGFATRWDEAVDLDSRTIARARQFNSLPNGPDGSWQGDNPLPAGASAPRTGVAVVYVLFDDDGSPCYVGSSMQFRSRLTWHRKRKSFRYWAAYPCADREDAYVREERMLREVLPRLNKKASR
ncbi:GIY-YIG nuclease family protein [Kineococcus sp. SYSU DK003]|uniref:GIY-YIG nuclease family protein n=1 Tax=Kineococcus sp. SYSU DK003 TaxID=3383124 RepID=UPI003D7E4EE4